MRNQEPEHSSLFNYAFVIGLLLSLLRGLLRCHISLINAEMGCKNFDDDEKRYIQQDGTHNSSYLTGMKKERRNTPEEWRILLRTGKYQDVQHVKPSAKRFKEVAEEHLIFKDDASELYFRDEIRWCLQNGNNPHLSPSVIDKLLRSSNEDDIATFIFNCLYEALMCDGNITYRNESKSENKKIVDEALRTAASCSASERMLYENDAENDDG